MNGEEKLIPYVFYHWLFSVGGGDTKEMADILKIELIFNRNELAVQLISEVDNNITNQTFTKAADLVKRKVDLSVLNLSREELLKYIKWAESEEEYEKANEAKIQLDSLSQ